MTIKELRAREVSNLAYYHNPNYTLDEWHEAKRLMNSFYRLCGLCERNLYLANDERTCSRESTKRSEAREHKWYTRLKAEFEAFSGLTLTYCGYMPSIGTLSNTGGFTEKISRWFYD